MEYKIIEIEEAPCEIKEWLKDNIKIKGSKIFIVNDYVYVVITRGEMKTGGYGIDVNLVEKKESIEIIIKYINPDEKQVVIQAITYPLIIIKFKKTDKDIVIKDEKKV